MLEVEPTSQRGRRPYSNATKVAETATKPSPAQL